MKTDELLMELSRVDGPSGFEDEVIEKIENILGGGIRTKLGGLVYEVEGGDKKLGVFAHVDEISLLVSKKGEDGFFYLEPSGGVDPKVVVSKKVKIFTRGGVLRGVIGNIAPHITPPSERGKPRDFDRLVLDATMSDWKKIEIGDRVVLDVEPFKMGDYVVGKALDNRAGCAVLIKLKEFLQRYRNLPTIYLVFSTREEIGGPGARSIAYELGLDWAIVVDVTFGDEKVEGMEAIKLGKGPAIGKGPSIDGELFEIAKDVAKRNGIEYQIEPLPGRSGTDTDDVQITGIGVRTLLVSVPLKNMHTPVEKVDPRDVEESARLIAEIASHLGR